MSIFKCKMCGAALEVDDTASIVQCEYCGTTQTLPRLDSREKEALYDRANHFRRNNEFDRAIGIYEQIVQADPTDAEAYWSLVLCRYGIEYVEDPASHNRIPTVNRAQLQPIFRDADYLQALKYADSSQKELYKAEAQVIDRIQSGILQISRQEEPFDIFLCYKEKDAAGNRTPDSVLAMDLYQVLTKEGYRVFFSRITLEDKLGTAYEPYIFAALHSAKVMVVLGTKAEYFQSAWVKNEWSRYLALIRGGAEKVLIPAFRDMDPYDLPEEFSHLQAQDMGKLGFQQDLVHGIQKFLLPRPSAVPVQQTPANTADTLVRRAFVSLLECDWKTADHFCEQALNLNPELAMAYVGKLLIDLQIPSLDALHDCDILFEDHPKYKLALQFADPMLKQQLTELAVQVRANKEQAEQAAAYEAAVQLLSQAKAASSPDQTLTLLSQACMQLKTCETYQNASELLEDARWQMKLARKASDDARVLLQRKRKKQVRTVVILAAVVLFLTGSYFAATKWIIPSVLQSQAITSIKDKDYEQAARRLARLESYVSSPSELASIRYQEAIALREIGSYDDSIAIFEALKEEEQLQTTMLAKGKVELEQGQYLTAIETLTAVKACPEAEVLLNQARFEQACIYEAEGDYRQAVEAFQGLDNAGEHLSRCRYAYAMEALAGNNYDDVIENLWGLQYKDAEEQLQKVYMEAAQYYLAQKEYRKALDYYQASEEFDNTSEFYLSTVYAYGKALELDGLYREAIEQFTYCSSYKDSSQHILDCKYFYVLNSEKDDVLSYSYLQDLAENEYQTAGAMLEERFGWRIENLVVNTSPDDSTTNLSEISVYDPIYFHFRLEGGPPISQPDIHLKIAKPDGTTFSFDDWSSPLETGCTYWYGWENGLYTNPAYGAGGELTVIFYDGNDRQLSSASVYLY